MVSEHKKYRLRIKRLTEYPIPQTYTVLRYVTQFCSILQRFCGDFKID